MGAILLGQPIDFKAYLLPPNICSITCNLDLGVCLVLFDWKLSGDLLESKGPECLYMIIYDIFLFFDAMYLSLLLVVYALCNRDMSQTLCSNASNLAFTVGWHMKKSLLKCVLIVSCSVLRIYSVFHTTGLF